ncbi:cytosine deaminase [Delphinella strobiligena]|nr:cytosine deaminase [Delphinella strobiligena]
MVIRYHNENMNSIEDLEQSAGWKAALDEAKQGASEGGVPIGACLVDANGKILGRGHNMRIQKGSATIHAEICALENAGRLPASAYRGATMFTTLSPCDMCTGSCILYKVKRVVLGENNTFVRGEDYLKQRGIEVINLKNAEAEGLMKKFIHDHPEDWYEDIGEE